MGNKQRMLANKIETTITISKYWVYIYIYKIVSINRGTPT